jgi:hypothetical protein
MNLLVIVPLLIAALFAYQAGNSFELTAGTSRFQAAAQVSSSAAGRQNARQKTPLPVNALINAFIHALIYQYLLSTTLLFALRTSVPQRLRRQLLAPIKFTSRFVG